VTTTFARVALVTGGAHGQGRSHALALAAAGYDVAVVDRCEPLTTIPYPMGTKDELDETVAGVEALDCRALGLRGDVRSLSEMSAAVDRVVSDLGRIDVLVANAGVNNYGSLWELTEEQWDENVGVNLKGVWVSMKTVVPHMIGQRSGRVIATSSVFGLRGYPNIGHYSAAKHGVIGLVKTLAMEVAEYDITVNAVCPSVVDTDMTNNAATYDLFNGAPGGSREHMVEVVQGMHILPGRGPIPASDVSEAVVWLASGAARNTTAAAITVDGGFLNRM
jgi:SDR family mycofactocin-dependent oxidoreductase